MSPQKQVCRIQRGLPRAFQQQKGQLAADAQAVQLPKGQLVLSGIAELHGLAGVAQAPCQTGNAVLLPGGKSQITADTLARVRAKSKRRSTLPGRS